MIFIYSTFPTKKEAERAGEGLIQKKLAACVNIFAIDAIYFWRGKIEKGKEAAVIIKTEKNNFKKVEKFILENHRYDTPCILEIPIGRATRQYAKWLQKTVN